MFLNVLGGWPGNCHTHTSPRNGEKYRRHQSFPKRSGSNTRTINAPSRLSVSFADIPSAQGHMNVTLDPDTPNIASLDRGQPSVASAPKFVYTRSSLEQSVSVLQPHEEEIDELHDVSQDSVVTSSSRRFSSRNPQRRSRGFADTSIWAWNQMI